MCTCAQGGSIVELDVGFTMAMFQGWRCTHLLIVVHEHETQHDADVTLIVPKFLDPSVESRRRAVEREAPLLGGRDQERGGRPEDSIPTSDEESQLDRYELIDAAPPPTQHAAAPSARAKGARERARVRDRHAASNLAIAYTKL